MIQLIPVLLVAPLVMRGEVEFGVIGQSTMVFATLLGALSLVITRFQAISSYGAVVSRLGEFVEATGKIASRRTASGIGFRHEAGPVAFEALTLRCFMKSFPTSACGLPRGRAGRLINPDPR
jgi:putative ATP-binding cassette transporter